MALELSYYNPTELCSHCTAFMEKQGDDDVVYFEINGDPSIKKVLKKAKLSSVEIKFGCMNAKFIRTECDSVYVLIVD